MPKLAVSITLVAFATVADGYLSSALKDRLAEFAKDKAMTNWDSNALKFTTTSKLVGYASEARFYGFIFHKDDDQMNFEVQFEPKAGAAAANQRKEVYPDELKDAKFMRFSGKVTIGGETKDDLRVILANRDLFDFEAGAASISNLKTDKWMNHKKNPTAKLLKLIDDAVPGVEKDLLALLKAKV